ncbi:MAG: toll/interleukin-1 receptor domain-containing protein [Pyrinomonadaceae bacterium]
MTPTVSPSPSPIPVVVAGVTPETTSPTPTPAPSATPNAPETRFGGRWLIPLAIIAALGAGAFIAAKLFSSQLGDFLKSTFSGSTAGQFKREGAAAVVYGGLKQKADVVHCTVYAPPRVAPGDMFIVQVFAHLAKQAKRLAEQAARADATARDHGSKPLQGEVERGTLLTFTLEAPGLKVDEVHRQGETLVWRGEPESVQFAVDVPEEHAAAKPTRCTVRIYSGEARAPVGHIMFMLDVAATSAPAASANLPSPPPQTLKRYTHAFISYCSKDRDKVLPIYLGKRTEWRKAGITDFFDRKDIAAGAAWRAEIQKNLDKCDLFVLFWSTSAMCSEEVGKEIAYALARKGSDEWNPPAFDPLSIELPVPRPLPAGLESLNFDDPLLYFIKAEEASGEEGDATSPRPGGGTT